MKKKTILMTLIAMIAMWMPMNSCVGQNLYTDDGPNVERRLDLKGFKAIENYYSAKIHYTHGSHYSVKISGSQKGIDMMDISVKDGTLFINIKKQYREKSLNIKKGITLYITSPEINSISNRGSLTLIGNQWKMNDLNISSAGALTMQISTLNCQTLCIENRGSLRYTDGEVHASQVNLSNIGATTLNLSFSVKNTFQVANRGSLKFEGKVDAKSYIESCKGATNDNIKINAETLELNINGSGKINSIFKGKTATITGGGASNIHMTVDCDKLSITSNGSSKITVKGTADDTTVESRGITQVDATGLNKF